MQLIKTKYITAPYSKDTKFWTDLVMRFSAYCVRKHDGILEDNMPILMENCHATIASGGYGTDPVLSQQTLLKMQKLASEKQNDLIVLTQNNGRTSSKVTKEVALWASLRKSHWATGTQFLTVAQAEDFLRAEVYFDNSKKQEDILCYWCTDAAKLKKLGKFDVIQFCSLKCEFEHRER